MEENKTKSCSEMMEMLSPKKTFIIGFVGGMLLLCTLGFFILVGAMVKGSCENKAAIAPAEQKQEVAVEAPADDKPAFNVSEITDEDRIRGDKNAPITIVEYSDLECPFCNRFHSTMKNIMEKYDGKVRWVLRHNPLSFHPNAQAAAEATECAGDQGKFWELSDYMYDTVAKEGKLTRDDFDKYASAVGLNVNTFNSCLDSGKYTEKVKSHPKDVPGRGTPFSIVLGPDGEEIPVNGAQPQAAVETIIDGILN